MGVCTAVYSEVLRATPSSHAGVSSIPANLVGHAADCAAVEHEFSAAGTYTVSWSMVQADAVDEWAWIYGERLDD
ncbi:MAG TPA: hypothetical protein VER33_22965 [Polyangiaceae bacterium]|nr:hypothetical protein [Polyangiaceae bacterium]